MPKVVHLSTDRWSFGRARAAGFPLGLTARLVREFTPGPLGLHLCCGWAYIPGFVHVDLATERGRVTELVADALHLPFRTGVFDFVLADPPYEGYDSQRLYGTGPVPLYRLLEEISRVCKPGGRYAVLYPFSPHTLSGDTRLREVVITLQVHQRPRMLNLFMRGMMPGVASYQYVPGVNGNRALSGANGKAQPGFRCPHCEHPRGEHFRAHRGPPVCLVCPREKMVHAWWGKKVGENAALLPDGELRSNA